MYNKWHSRRTHSRDSGGYTLMELLGVIGIIAVACAIAIPSILAISRSLAFKQRNDYAKSIFLAAQTNLTEMRSNGGLGPLRPDSTGTPPSGSETIPSGAGFPSESWSDEYLFVSSDAVDSSAFDMVLPAGSIDSAVRGHNIIIEYNPHTGNVYSVFYSQDGDLTSDYRSGLPRDDTAARKERMLGYYCGSGLASSHLELEKTQAVVEYTNGEEGIVTVRIPVPDLYYSKLDEFANGLQVELLVSGDRGGEFQVIAKRSGSGDNYTVAIDGKTILVEYVLDSLRDTQSFANLSTGTAGYLDASDPTGLPGPAPAGAPLTALRTEKDAFFGGADPASAVPDKILPGDNVTITANVTYTAAGASPSVTIEPGVLAGVNPMFSYLQEAGSGKYVLAVSNGRNLQNLNALSPSVGAAVETVLFEDDIYWNKTVDYYNRTYGTDAGGKKLYQNGEDEAPARALPYFVPIHSDALFGTARFIFPGEGDGGLGDILGSIWDSILDEIFGIQTNRSVPTLTDELDRKMSGKHASIQGNHKNVYFLNIDSTKYKVPENGTFYAAKNQVIDYYFTGLFGYANTTIDNLNVVNPIIKGHNFDDGKKLFPVYSLFPSFSWDRGWYYPVIDYVEVRVENNPATGALLGAGGFNTLISNCGTYIDINAEGFTRSAMHQGDYNASQPQNWYGVSGEGAVGGLVGYCKSHHSVTGELTNDKNHLAFSRAFAAVPVSGNMRGNNSRDFGYSNGVGGLVGNSQLSNFYNCYASGSVRANGCYVVTNHDLAGLLGQLGQLIGQLIGVEIDIPYNGRTGTGCGGFVGTSHGTRYTNCFATGNVNGNLSRSSESGLGVGGFVGVMNLDETFTYGNDDSRTKLAQRTVFTDCYSVGLATTNGQPVENFSGANARIRFTFNQNEALMTGDYYRLYAPVYHKYGREPNYEDVYIHRNAYYLSQYFLDKDNSQSNSNNCANPEFYDTLQNLPGSHQNLAWRQARIDEIKKIEIGLWGLGGTYNKYFTAASHMQQRYEDLYATGYQTGWEPATRATTHPYNQAAAGTVYPFSKLEGMDYYGDWPGKPSAVGLAYYETYAGNETIGTRFYYDRDETSTLTINPQDVVSSDGYAVLSASKTNPFVTVDGHTFQLSRYTDTFSTGTQLYYAFPLTHEVMQAAAEQAARTGEFYVPLVISDGAASYTTYFNPNLALTQVNPYGNNVKDAIKPETVPEQLYIRSARQLAQLTEMPYAWGENFHYVQQLNVDVTKNIGVPDGRQVALNHSIGSQTVPFAGSYNGSMGYVTKAQILGFVPNSGLFGTTAPTARVQDLSLTVGADLTIQTPDAAHAGVLMAVNQGLIENVDLVLNGTVSVTAKESAGLLVGSNIRAASSAAPDAQPDSKENPSGTLRRCTVTAAKPVTLNAANAGGVIGQAKGGTVEDITLNAASAITASGRHLGGMVGDSSLVDYRNVDLIIHSISGTGSHMGGFAGVLEGGSATSISVSLAGSSTLTHPTEPTLLGGFAGAAGLSQPVSAMQWSVALNKGGSLSADTVAGLFGTADAVSLNSANVILDGKLTGVQAAAGAAGSLGEQSSLAQIFVQLSFGMTSQDKAAGFATDVKGHVQKADVLLTGKAVSGKKEAAGFANTISGKIENCTVSSNQAQSRIVGASAAGFVNTAQSGGQLLACTVTPARLGDVTLYAGNSNANLLVKGSTTSAGFASAVEKDAFLTNCDTLCQLEKGAAGFAGTNAGSLDGCIANVTLPDDGHAFTGKNDGTISNCYAWFGNGTANPSALTVTAEEMGQCRSSYFANIQAMETDEGLDTVFFFDQSGAYSTMKPSALGQTSILAKMNSSTTRWFAPKTFAAYPYNVDMPQKDYLYPMLRPHCGDWVVPPYYPFGVAYYEQYTDGSWKFQAAELSDHTLTIDKQDLTGYYISDAQTQNVSPAPDGTPFDKTGTIQDAGYALFCRAGTNPFASGLLGDAIPDAPVIKGITQPYHLQMYHLNAAPEQPEVTLTTDTGDTVRVHTHYAHAFDVKDNTYTLRAGSQFAHMADGKNFVQTHDIRAEAAPALPVFSTDYNGSGCTLTLAESGSWIQKVTGSLHDVTLRVTGAVTAPLFDTIEKQGSVSLNGLTVGSLAEKSGIVQTLNGSFACPSICVNGDAKASLFGMVNTALPQLKISITKGLYAPVMGTLTSGLPVQDLTVSAARADVERAVIVPLADSCTFANCTISIPEITLTGTESAGILAGALTGGTVENCTVSGETLLTAQTGMVGGLVGTSTADLTDNTIEHLTIELTGDNDKATVTGGLVGSNTGSITGGTVHADIRYTQPDQLDGESAVIGGMVGKMEQGSMTGGQVTGSISLLTITPPETPAPSPSASPETSPSADPEATPTTTPETTPTTTPETTPSASPETTPEATVQPKPATGKGRSYTVGGVVGQDGAKAVYTDIASRVVIAPEWADQQDASSICPAGLGAVGKFVGTVTDGSFTNCSAADGAQDTGYHFLGKIQTEARNTSKLLESGVFSHGGLALDGKPVQAEDGTENFPGYTSADNQEYTVYSALLENCTFDLNGETHQQTIQLVDYFYQQTDRTKTQEYKPGAALSVVFGSPQKLTYADLGAGEKTLPKLATDAYYSDADGVLHRVYLAVSYEDGFFRDTADITLSINGKSFHTITLTSDLFDSVNFGQRIKDDTKELMFRKLSAPAFDPNQQYLLVNRDRNMAAVQSSKFDVSRQFASHPFFDDGLLWQPEGSGWKNSFTGRYLDADGSGISKNAAAVTGKFALEDSYAANAPAWVTLGKTDYQLYPAVPTDNWRMTALFQPLPIDGGYAHSEICTSKPTGTDSQPVPPAENP